MTQTLEGTPAELRPLERRAPAAGGGMAGRAEGTLTSTGAGPRGRPHAP